MRTSAPNRLHQHGVSIAHADDGDARLPKESRIEDQNRPDPVGGLLIRQLSRTFELPQIARTPDSYRLGSTGHKLIEATQAEGVD